MSRRIDTVGYVGYDEDTLQHIHTRVDGWIESLEITATGDPVSQGQTLFELYSPTLVNAEEEYLTALRSGNLTLLSASRERLVALGQYQDGLISHLHAALNVSTHSIPNDSGFRSFKAGGGGFRYAQTPHPP